MSEPRHRRMTPDEFFAWQKSQDRNYELVDGAPVLPLKAMTGATRAHDRLTVRALASLSRQLAGGPCEPSTQDIAVRTPLGGVRRPDVLIDCGSFNPTSMEAAEPRVVVEVLSPSTTNVDRFRKVEEYKSHPSIRVILLVDTRSARVGAWRRSGQAWEFEDHQGTDTSIPLPEIGATLDLEELYRGYAFEG
jgi:Uma2 family endonuclease